VTEPEPSTDAAPSRLAGLVGQAVSGAALLAAGIAVGAILFGGDPAPPPGGAPAEQAAVWTCSMHPQVRLPEEGQCPICHMDLIPVSSHGDAEEGEAELVLSEAAKALAEVRTAAVKRAPAARELELVGRVTYDETRVQRVSSFVPGRIERLYVEVTGTRVKRGEHLLRIYSPELLAAQNEWIGALRQAKQAPAGTAARSVLEKTAAAAEERLRLWGLSDGQRARLREGGAVQQTITIYAPRGGVVVERQAVVGMYVKEGSPLYTVAELDRLWVELDAFEIDLPHVRFGQVVRLSTDAMPGRAWAGRVAFVAPIVDERSRTVRVRVNFDNDDGALKPGMLVRATLHASVDAHGHAVSEEDLEEAWVCPMHPDVVKARPGRCDVCGMALEAASSLGLVSAASGERPLLIPASAPLLTGKRAVVYVEVLGRDRPTYEGRAVVLGPRVGDAYVVLEGVSEGELVVVEGAFKLDAAMQVKAKPSLMNGALGPDSAHAPLGAERPLPSDAPAPAFRPGDQPRVRSSTASSPPTKAKRDRKAESRVLDAYLDLERALSSDDASAATQAAATLASAVKGTRDIWPAGWKARATSLGGAAEQLAAATDLKSLRTAFVAYSAVFLAALDESGAPRAGVHRFFCPMANGGKGAEWLQRTDDLTNPYFGAKMLKCGEQRGELAVR
jgi:Cu(I)/Ag(I) efflux system membrane fusion protein